MEQEYNIIGKKASSFTNQAGETVHFGKLYVTFTDADAEGMACKDFSVKPEYLDNFEIGTTVHILFNQYGKVCGCLPV